MKNKFRGVSPWVCDIWQVSIKNWNNKCWKSRWVNALWEFGWTVVRTRHVRSDEGRRKRGRTCMWDETGIIKRFIRLLSRSYSALFIHPGAFLLPFYKTLLLAMAHRKTGERKRMETGVLLIKIYERDSQISYAVVSAWDIRGIWNEKRAARQTPQTRSSRSI